MCFFPDMYRSSVFFLLLINTIGIVDTFLHFLTDRKILVIILLNLLKLLFLHG